MQINWKVRLRNPVFWVTAVPLFVTMIYTWLGICGFTPSLSQSVLVDAIMLVVEFLSLIGVLVDPTTAGASDSKNALTYDKPRKD